MLPTIMSDKIQFNKQNYKYEDSWGKAENNQPLLKIMNIPSDLKNIQPRSMQVWKCDEIGFYTNVKWHKVICTYKFFLGERMWKLQTG